MAAFSQQGRGGEIGAAGFEAQQQPQAALAGRGRLGQQVGVEQAAQAVAAHGALVHLAAHHHATTPGAGRAGLLLGGEKLGLGLENPEHQKRAVEATALLVDPIKDPLPLQPVALGQGQGP